MPLNCNLGYALHSGRGGVKNLLYALLVYWLRDPMKNNTTESDIVPFGEGGLKVNLFSIFFSMM